MDHTNLTRREFLRAASWTAAGGAVAGTLSARGRQASQPNFVIILADDLGWNDLGCYGHRHIRTPNIDRLAAEGLKFTHAFLTCSSCSPTRCSIMTGRYPHSTGARELHQPLPADQPQDCSVAYSSVVGFGRVRMVDDPVEKLAALEAIMLQYYPKNDAWQYPEKVVAACTVWCIEIAHLTGKFKRPPREDQKHFE